MDALVNVKMGFLEVDAIELVSLIYPIMIHWTAIPLGMKPRVDYYELTVGHVMHVLVMDHVKMGFANAIKIILMMVWQGVLKHVHLHPTG